MHLDRYPSGESPTNYDMPFDPPCEYQAKEQVEEGYIDKAVARAGDLYVDGKRSTHTHTHTHTHTQREGGVDRRRKG